MALFADLLKAVSGATGVAVGSQMLQQDGGTTSIRQFTPGPSSAEQQGFQLSQAIQLANLQHAGYDMTRGEDGSITLTPRATAQTQFEQQFGPGIQAGLQREMGGPSLSPLGGVLNTQAMAGATGRPSINRQALIQAIQQKRGPQQATGLGLAPGPSPITVGPVSSEASFGGFPSGGGTQQGGLLSSIPGGGATLGALGGTLGGLALAQKLGLFGSGGQTSFNTRPFDPTGSFAIGPQSSFGGGDFAIDEAAGDWTWVPDEAMSNFDWDIDASFW